ncbi:cyclic lactone autoinducer peptide [Lactiplantibacillus plantarum]|nr:cyclic lactone autoinducer peptide [Lactiplantibacillus plantarum]MDN7044343.1 cyclic lactone autoinducer peptide [Lactiplantibacillus plantarum]
MKNLFYKAIAQIFKYIGSKQLVMCCHGIYFETKIPEELRIKD